jgi:hypothetical protein
MDLNIHSTRKAAVTGMDHKAAKEVTHPILCFRNKTLTKLQQSYNAALTTIIQKPPHLCIVINWLFIIWFWLVKKVSVF